MNTLTLTLTLTMNQPGWTPILHAKSVKRLALVDTRKGVTWDLRNAFCHIPMHKEAHKFLCFTHRVRMGQFRSCPPASLQPHTGYRHTYYLDGWILIYQDRDSCLVSRIQFIMDLRTSCDWQHQIVSTNHYLMDITALKGTLLRMVSHILRTLGR